MSGWKKTWQSRFEEPKPRPTLHIFPPPSIPPTARIIPPLPAEELVTALLSRSFSWQQSRRIDCVGLRQSNARFYPQLLPEDVVLWLSRPKERRMEMSDMASVGFLRYSAVDKYVGREARIFSSSLGAVTHPHPKVVPPVPSKGKKR